MTSVALYLLLLGVSECRSRPLTPSNLKPLLSWPILSSFVSSKIAVYILERLQLDSLKKPVIGFYSFRQRGDKGQSHWWRTESSESFMACVGFSNISHFLFIRTNYSKYFVVFCLNSMPYIHVFNRHTFHLLMHKLSAVTGSPSPDLKLGFWQGSQLVSKKVRSVLAGSQEKKDVLRNCFTIFYSLPWYSKW